MAVTRWFLTSALFAVCAPLALAAEAQSGPLLFQEAKILYDNLQYPEALAKLKEAVRAPGNKRSDLVEIYQLMGFVYIVQGRKTPAQRAFEILLKLSPAFELNPILTSPKILDFFNKVKDEMRIKERVVMNHTPLGESPASERIEVRAYVIDLQLRLQSMKLYFRRRSEPNYSVADMTASVDAAKGEGARTYTGAIPFLWTIDDETELFIDYYIAGLDDWGNWLANSGTPKEPLTFRINLMSGELPEGARKQPLVSKWWFWTLLGVGAAGAITGTVFGVIWALEPGPPNFGEAVLVLH